MGIWDLQDGEADDQVDPDDPALVKWFETTVRRYVAVWGTSIGLEEEAEYEQLVAWAVAERGALLRWEPYDRFRGNGYPNGEWRYDLQHLKSSLAAHVRQQRDKARAAKVTAEERAAAVAREDEASRYPTLEAWLAAFHAGKLTAPAFKGLDYLDGILPGRGLSDIYTKLSPAARSQLHGSEHRRASWPRLCRDCWKEYRPENGNRHQQVRCRECLDRRRGRPDGRRRTNREG